VTGLRRTRDVYNTYRYFSIETHIVVTEYAYMYLIPEKCLVFIFAYT